MSEQQSTQAYDVAIVGGGPAGLTAALYGGRSKLSTIVLERGNLGGQLWNTAEIDDYPGLPMITGPDMAVKLHEHAAQFGAEFEVGEEVETLTKQDDVFTLKTTSGSEFQALSVIVTAGGTARKLGVKGEDELAGRGVSYCAVCDGAFFQDKTIAVVGGGDSAVEEGTFLTRYGSKVYVIHRRDEFRASASLVEHMKESEKIETILDTTVEEIVGDGTVTGVKLKNVLTGEQTELAVDAVFPFVGFIPHSEIFEAEMVELEDGYVVTDYKMQTKTPGLFVAGDVRAQFIRQITNAVGDATVAALAASAYVEDVKRTRAKTAA